ncbi:MAG: hypothetical protein KDH99_11175, partial [Alcanivoracaceae bacterium]|nr:hypothetical protein [Alcanivoracaceae bacterium]
MAEIPENKQKRLMSLNQDVLAVSSGQAPARDETLRTGASAGGDQVTETGGDSRSLSPLLVMLLLLVALAGMAAGVAGMLIARDSQ